jgi:hypothetical protein
MTWINAHPKLPPNTTNELPARLRFQLGLAGRLDEACLRIETMLNEVIDALAHRMQIDHALARQSLAMMLEALHENDAGELASVLEARIPDLGNVEATGSGGGGFGLAGESAGLVSGTADSGVHGLKALLGSKADQFGAAASEVIGKQAGPALGQQLAGILQRIM